MRTASLRRQHVLVEEAADVGVAGRVDVDRERRLRLLAHALERVVDDRRKRLRISDDLGVAAPNARRLPWLLAASLAG